MRTVQWPIAPRRRVDDGQAGARALSPASSSPPLLPGWSRRAPTARFAQSRQEADRRQSQEPAAERSGLVEGARRRRGGAPLRQAVEVRGACRPPRRRVADRLARKLGQLHAAARARRHHHAERPVLRAPSRRHRRDQSARPPADDPRPRRQAADLHAGRHQAHAARQPRLLPRMRRQFRHGVARRAAQRLPVHARHGAQRDVHRRAAQAPARRGRPQAERQVAAARRRRRRRHDPLAAAREGARRRAASPSR